MDLVCKKLVDETQRDARKLHATWNDALFTAYAAGPAASLWKNLEGEVDSKVRIMSAYLKLVQEAIASGYTQNCPSPKAPGKVWASFLELALVRLIPDNLAAVPVSKRLEILAAIWNIGEGLVREPVWVDRLVIARSEELNDLSKLENSLTEILEPAFEPIAPAKWNGPFLISTLDIRPLDNDFLPGEMHLSAPSVVCISDRRRDARAGVFLKRGGKSRFLGLTGEMPVFREEVPDLRVDFERNIVRINGNGIDVPFLNSAKSHTVSRGGFIIVASVDSQRIWIVESS